MLVLTAVPAGAQVLDPAPRVALTFDDLPLANADAVSPAEAAAINRDIRAALRRAQAPAIGFVTENNVVTLGDAGKQMVRDWIAEGFALGNHGASHADANLLDLVGFAAEIEVGERTIAPLAKAFGQKLRFYRFAYNHVGETDAKRIAFEGELARRGYRLAASTIDTSDYLFDRAYFRARGDAALQARIARAYLDHSRVQIRYYQGLNHEVLGRAPPAVMLLHANALNAATLDDLIALFRAEGFGFVSLVQAQADPAYVKSPAVATRFGPMWGYRWAKERGVRVDGSKEQEPPAWVQRYAENGVLAEAACGDLLAEAGRKPAQAVFVECVAEPEAQGKPLRATYRVRGRDAAVVEAYLIKAVGLQPLRRSCCQWDSPPAFFRDAGGRDYMLTLASPETSVRERGAWGLIAEFELSVARFTEEI